MITFNLLIDTREPRVFGNNLNLPLTPSRILGGGELDKLQHTYIPWDQGNLIILGVKSPCTSHIHRLLFLTCFNINSQETKYEP